MGHFAEVYYHLVWATRGREHYLTGETELIVHDFIRYKCKQLRSSLHAVNGMADHIHIACSIPLSMSVADYVERIKGTSSRFVNDRAAKQDEMGVCLYWQQGYGALTFGGRDLSTVVKYIDNQKARHQTGKLSAKMEECGQPDT